MKILKQIYPRNCANGACPGILVTDADLVFIQGSKVEAQERDGLAIPGHEDVVGIPKAIFEELMRRYRRGKSHNP